MTSDKCALCRYSCAVDCGEDGRMLRACLYLLRRGERRPCPAGDGCTAFERRSRTRPAGITAAEQEALRCG